MALMAERPTTHDFNVAHNEPAEVKTQSAQNQTEVQSTSVLRTINDLITLRAAEPGSKDEPIINYPSPDGEYVGHTPAQINALAENAAAHYANSIPRRLSSDDPVQVVGLLGVSHIEYLITLLALSKLGHTVLFLSTRISEEAHVSLIAGTKATTLLVDNAFVPMGEKVKTHFPALKVGRIASKEDYESPASLHTGTSTLDPKREAKNVAWIIHSSGSTSLPKPVFITHRAALTNYTSQFSLVGYVTLPLFHAHGLSCTFRAIMMRKPIYLYDAGLPLTSQHLVRTLKQHPDIRVFYGVPYALKLLVETDEGVQLLARLEVVMFGGSACPKPLGDKLVQAGVLLVGHYGSTETGQLMTSFRGRDDLDWDFVRPSQEVQPYLQFEPYAPGIYELVVLDGWRSKVATNREDGSYATKDLFEKHPTKNAYRYYARKDDTIVLVNGEKANPLLHEGAAKQNGLVSEAVVFGAQRPHLGMFVIPTASSSCSREQIVEEIWPDVERANNVVPAYARLSKDMIRLLPADAEYRKTDKSTVIRAAFYKTFAEEIDAIYDEAEPEGSLKLIEADLRDYLHVELRDRLRINDSEDIKDDTDIFSLGIDSLQASQMRAKITRELDLGGHKLGQNFVFDFPNINAMASELLRMRTGADAPTKKPVEKRMEAMVEKYSRFEQHMPTDDQSDSNTVLVTGATGSLGAHLVANLVSRADVSKVICLVRAASDGDAADRVLKSLQQRKVVAAGDALPSKLLVHASSFADPKLGLKKDVYDSIASQLTSIIHCAWSVNFNMGLESFEKDCVAGTKHLLDLCLKARQPRPASFNFCSSASAVASSPGPNIAEDLPTSLSYAQNMGYAKSKLVTEHICTNASKSTGMHVKVLRTGQIIGDTQHGIWNAQEAIPMIFQSAKTVGALPKLDESPSWLPVDIVGEALAQLSLSTETAGGVYHVVNRRTFHWTKDLLPQLHKAGLDFDEVGQQDWLERLRRHPDPVRNPPSKLLPFFMSKYDRNTPRPRLIYDSEKACAASSALATAPVLDQRTVDGFVQYLSGIWESSAK